MLFDLCVLINIPLICQDIWIFGIRQLNFKTDEVHPTVLIMLM